MNIIDFIIIFVIALIFGLTLFFYIKNKKEKKSCINCPYAKRCNNDCKTSSKTNNNTTK